MYIWELLSFCKTQRLYSHVSIGKIWIDIPMCQHFSAVKEGNINLWPGIDNGGMNLSRLDLTDLFLSNTWVGTIQRFFHYLNSFVLEQTERGWCNLEIILSLFKEFKMFFINVPFWATMCTWRKENLKRDNVSGGAFFNQPECNPFLNSCIQAIRTFSPVRGSRLCRSLTIKDTGPLQQSYW